MRQIHRLTLLGMDISCGVRLAAVEFANGAVRAEVILDELPVKFVPLYLRQQRRRREIEDHYNG